MEHYFTLLEGNLADGQNQRQTHMSRLKQYPHARGVATGGIGIYTPKSVTVLFTCGTLTHVLKLQ